MNWQDISTAPKDGTTILGYMPERAFNVPIDDVATIYWYDEYATPAWVDTVSGENVDPTHWMPLPEPPKE